MNPYHDAIRLLVVAAVMAAVLLLSFATRPVVAPGSSALPTGGIDVPLVGTPGS